jgi:hypothetical protein
LCRIIGYYLIKLIDFGFVRRVHRDEVEKSSIFGVLAVMAGVKDVGSHAMTYKLQIMS